MCVGGRGGEVVVTPYRLTASGTWHFMVVYMYIQHTGTWHWPSGNAEVHLAVLFVCLFLFPLLELSGWMKQKLYECFDGEETTKEHWVTAPSAQTLDMYRPPTPFPSQSHPQKKNNRDEVGILNVLNFVQFYRNLSLCDKARVAFNLWQVKGTAGSPECQRVVKREKDRESEESTFLYRNRDVCLHSFN